MVATVMGTLAEKQGGSDGRRGATTGERCAGGRMLVVAVVMTVAAFVAASCAALSRLQEIRQDSRAIVDSALPSVVTLSAARRQLGRIAAITSQLDGIPLTSQTVLELRRALGRLEVHAKTYVTLAAYRGQHDDWWVVRACIDELGAVLDNLDASNPVSPSPAAQSRMMSAIDRADAVLLAMIDFTTKEIETFVGQIESKRVGALRRALFFNGIGVVLAALLLMMALRSLRRRIAAERQAQCLLENRAAELETFAARVAHDLVSPLAPTLLWLERLRDSPEATTRKAAEKALRGVGRVTELVDALFAFARAPRETHPAAHSDLDQVARDVLSCFEEPSAASDVTLELVSSGSLPVDIHSGLVASILGNLVQNAIRYLGDAPIRRVTVRLQRINGRARVEVIDTGPGIPLALQQRIFDPYFRAAERDQPLGLGLGLATARRLVEANGGTIGVASVGVGSTFWFELPISRES